MRATLKSLRDSLRPIYGRGETEAIIRIIFHHLKGWSAVDMIVHEGEPLSPFIKTEIEKIRQRLLKQEPIQYITGEARFHGLNLKVSPDVLIPRPETEELVDLIVDEADDRTDLRVLDIGTGSGCIAIALARSLRFPYVYALDVSQKALQVARENAAEHKVNISFIEADIFSWQPSETFDIIVSNPPYIDESEKTSMEDNVLLHEPHSALFVPDDDPLIFYRRITSLASESLNPSGRLYFEINPRHAADMKRMVINSGFSDVEIIKDSFGKDRFLTAKKQAL